MALQTFGKVTVTTGGTPVRVTSSHSGAQAIFIQAWHGNTGKIWVGNANMDKSTGEGVYGVVPPPSTGAQPAISFSIPLAPAGLDAADFWIDADNNGEGCIVTVAVQ